MQDRPNEEGIQPEAASLRSRGSTPEVPKPGGEGQPFYAEFSITIEDAMVVHDRALRAMKAGALKPSRRPRWIGYGIGFVFVAVYYASREGLVPEWVGTVLPSSAWMVAGSFLTVVSLLIFSRRNNRAVVRRIYENDRNLFVTHRITLTPEAVNYVIGPRSGKVLWEGIVDVTETLHYLFISYSPTDIILVPRHGFANRKEFEAFVEGAEQYFQASGSVGKPDADHGVTAQE
jgi:hypothetical protein